MRGGEQEKGGPKHYYYVPGTYFVNQGRKGIGSKKKAAKNFETSPALIPQVQMSEEERTISTFQRRVCIAHLYLGGGGERGLGPAN